MTSRKEARLKIEQTEGHRTGRRFSGKLGIRKCARGCFWNLAKLWIVMLVGFELGDFLSNSQDCEFTHVSSKKMLNKKG